MNTDSTNDNVITLAQWVIADDERADEDGDCSFRTLLHSTYSDDAPDVRGDFSYADEQLVGAGLIASQVDRTEHVETWRTDLGMRVHGLVCAMDRAEGAEDMGWSGRGF